MVNNIYAALLEGLFPNYCCLCKLRSYGEFPLCVHCRGELRPNRDFCARCALPLAPLDPPSIGDIPRICGQCLQHPPEFSSVVAPWQYTEHFAHLIHLWKFQHQRRLTPLLVDLWQQQASNLTAVDLIVPVPLHWQRLWKRGYNQSALLCRELQRTNSVAGKAALTPHLCKRHRATAAQSGIHAQHRASNLLGAFTALQRCDNLKVAVVDDVLTTGATANAIAGALRDAGAARVDIWCLARTPAPE